VSQILRLCRGRCGFWVTLKEQKTVSYPRSIAQLPCMIRTNRLMLATRFGLIVHHTDAEREWVYDRKSSTGKLDQALDAAPGADWTVVDMRNDWKKIFPFGCK
jgi:hypothetical protein